MKQVKFKTIFETEEGNNRVCLAALGDAWKRSAAFDRPDLAKKFNDAGRDICVAAQWWDLAENLEWPVKKTRDVLRELTEIALRENIDRITLPVAAKSAAGKFVAQQLRAVGGQAPNVIELHKDDYYVSRLHHFGSVDGRRKTGLDIGLVYRKDM
jgi:hypothetical protein